MPLNFHDLAAPRWDRTTAATFAQFPHGLLKPPAEILSHVAKEKARLANFYTPDFEKLTLDDLTLAYYFEGINVAYRSVPGGVEVLAVGAEEIGELVQSMPRQEHSDFIVGQP